MHLAHSAQVRYGAAAAVIFDVDGVLVESPHERAWREALTELMTGRWRALGAAVGYTSDAFSTAVYQAHVAGKPRLSGARAALEYFGVSAAEPLVAEYAARKQRRIEQLIEAGDFIAYPDALRLVVALKERGLRLAAASSSRNANTLMQRIGLGIGLPGAPGGSLLDVFDVNVCGRDLPFGKPHPRIFLVAAEELGTRAGDCVVIEDAPSGVQAARAGGMGAIGVARLHDEALLRGAGADVVVTSLDDPAVYAFVTRRTGLLLA